jgi:hypothetical protein
LREKKGRLYLRSRHFPPKPGSELGEQYEIGMGVHASPAGLKVALAKAKAIDSDLLWGRFDWKPYLKGKSKPAETVEEWVRRCEEYHWQHTPRTPTKENSYHKNYRLYYQKMSQQAALTVDLMRQTIVSRSDQLAEIGSSTVCRIDSWQNLWEGWGQLSRIYWLRSKRICGFWSKAMSQSLSCPAIPNSKI